jgi:hypothetical protein
MTTIAIFYIVDREIRSSTVEKEFIFAFPWAKWLHERATVLHYMYVGLSCMQCKFSLKSAYSIVNTSTIEVGRIVEFPSQQWFHVRAKNALHYAYVAFFVMANISAVNRTKTSKKAFNVAPLPPLRLIM